MQTTKRMTIDIRYDISDDAVFGGEDPNEHGLDAERSVEELVNLTEQAIREAYPDADISFTAEVRHGNQVWIDGVDPKTEDGMQIDIADIIFRVYDSQTWAVSA